MNRFEHVHPPESHEELGELTEYLQSALGQNISIESVSGVSQIETDTFRIQFDISGSIFDVHALKSHQPGTGRMVMEAIHRFCDEYDYDIIATDVADTARGFWVEMGYQEGSTENEFYRVG